MMPVTSKHTVLCVTCRLAADTVHAYPDRCCGVRGWVAGEGRRGAQVSCTRGTGLCTDGLHFDSYLAAEFGIVTRILGRSTEGKTGRA